MLLIISTSIGQFGIIPIKAKTIKTYTLDSEETIIQETQTNFLMDLNHDCQREISQVYIRLNPIHVELAETEKFSFAGG